MAFFTAQNFPEVSAAWARLQKARAGLREAKRFAKMTDHVGSMLLLAVEQRDVPLIQAVRSLNREVGRAMHRAEGK